MARGSTPVPPMGPVYRSRGATATFPVPMPLDSATDALRQLHAQLQNLTPPYKVQQVRDLTGTSRRYAHAMLTALRQLGYI